MAIREIEITDSAGLRDQLNADAIVSIERKGRIGEAPLILKWDDDVAPAPSEAEIQDAQDNARRARLHRYARTLARDKRRAVLGETDSSVPDDVLQSEFLSLQGRSAAKVRREANGRSKSGEADTLDQLEAQADALEAIDIALQAIRAKVESDDYTTEGDIENATEWP